MKVLEIPADYLREPVALPATVACEEPTSDLNTTVVRWIPLFVPLAAVLLCLSIGTIWACVL